MKQFDDRIFRYMDRPQIPEPKPTPVVLPSDVAIVCTFSSPQQPKVQDNSPSFQVEQFELLQPEVQDFVGGPRFMLYGDGGSEHSRDNMEYATWFRSLRASNQSKDNQNEELKNWDSWGAPEKANNTTEQSKSKEVSGYAESVKRVQKVVECELNTSMTGSASKKFANQISANADTSINDYKIRSTSKDSTSSPNRKLELIDTQIMMKKVQEPNELSSIVRYSQKSSNPTKKSPKRYSSPKTHSQSVDLGPTLPYHPYHPSTAVESILDRYTHNPLLRVHPPSRVVPNNWGSHRNYAREIIHAENIEKMSRVLKGGDRAERGVKNEAEKGYFSMERRVNSPGKEFAGYGSSFDETRYRSSEKSKKVVSGGKNESSAKKKGDPNYITVHVGDCKHQIELQKKLTWSPLKQVKSVDKIGAVIVGQKQLGKDRPVFCGIKKNPKYLGWTGEDASSARVDCKINLDGFKWEGSFLPVDTDDGNDKKITYSPSKMAEMRSSYKKEDEAIDFVNKEKEILSNVSPIDHIPITSYISPDKDLEDVRQNLLSKFQKNQQPTRVQPVTIEKVQSVVKPSRALETSAVYDHIFSTSKPQNVVTPRTLVEKYASMNTTHDQTTIKKNRAFDAPIRSFERKSSNKRTSLSVAGKSKEVETMNVFEPAHHHRNYRSTSVNLTPSHPPGHYHDRCLNPPTPTPPYKKLALPLAPPRLSLSGANRSITNSFHSKTLGTMYANTHDVKIIHIHDPVFELSRKQMEEIKGGNSGLKAKRQPWRGGK
jgi:hypothetical protein